MTREWFPWRARASCWRDSPARLNRRFLTYYKVHPWRALDPNTAQCVDLPRWTRPQDRPGVSEYLYCHQISCNWDPQSGDLQSYSPLNMYQGHMQVRFCLHMACISLHDWFAVVVIVVHNLRCKSLDMRALSSKHVGWNIIEIMTQIMSRVTFLSRRILHVCYTMRFCIAS